MSTWRLLLGDCRETLRPADSVQCVVTSPPYWGLRDYGHPEQLGLEPTPALYVEHMVTVFREVRRVMRPDGTLWLNLGDSYATGAGKVGECPGGGEQGERWKKHHMPQTPDRKNPGADVTFQPNRMPQEGLKPKDLVGIPWRVAFALQADGWWLRSDIIWHKPNPMPESVTDRPTKAHEYLFLLAKGERYYYDAEAIAEEATHAGRVLDYTGNQKANTADPVRQRTLPRGRMIEVADTRNARSVWTIPTSPYPGSHFAVFPPELAERCIKAGSKPGDTVLDPFGGSGTVGMVATGHGRHAILCELNPKYADLIRDRCGPMLEASAA